MELSISGTPLQKKDFTWETGINIAGNRGTMDGLPEGMEFMYVTDVQYGSAKAASISGGHFMAINEVLHDKTLFCENLRQLRHLRLA